MRIVLSKSLAIMVLVFWSGTSNVTALEVLVDNLSQTFNGISSMENTTAAAQSFVTDASGYIVTEVALRAYNDSGTTGAYEVQIWDNTGASGSPGAQVGSSIYSGEAGDLSTDPSNILLIDNLNVELQPSTTYYLVLKPVSLSPVGDPEAPFPGTLGMRSTSSTSGTGFPASRSYIVTGPSSSSGPFSWNFGVQVTAVPEPSTWAMGSLSCSLLGWSAMRRRRSSISQKISSVA
jgi:hypothetical protein